MAARFSAIWAAALVLLLVSPEQAGAQTAIEYASVAETKQALLAKPGAASKLQDGWLIVEEEGGAIWSFVPEGHEAFPAVGKRTLVEKDGSFSVATQILCEGNKQACDRLAESYAELDKQMMKAAEEELKKH